MEGISPAVNSLYPMPRPVIGCAALATAYRASMRSSDFCAIPRTFLEQVSICLVLVVMTASPPFDAWAVTPPAVAAPSRRETGSAESPFPRQREPPRPQLGPI